VVRHTFDNELRGVPPPEECPVLVLDNIMNPKVNREKMMQILFESFEIPSLDFAYTPVCALLSSGCTTGIVADIGAGGTQVLPIAEGYAYPHAAQRNDVGGDLVTESLKRMLRESGVKLSSEFTLNEIKEKTCRCATHVDEFQDCDTPVEFQLPDDRKITIHDQQIRAPEVIFRPELIGGRPQDGLAKTIHRALSECPISARQNFAQNVILAGAATMTRDLETRLSSELRNLLPGRCNVKSPPERRISAWIGGSIQQTMAHTLAPASRSAHLYGRHGQEPSLCYNEEGPRLVHQLPSSIPGL